MIRGALFPCPFVCRGVRACPQVYYGGAVPLPASRGCFGLSALFALRGLRIAMKKALPLFPRGGKGTGGKPKCFLRLAGWGGESRLPGFGLVPLVSWD